MGNSVLKYDTRTKRIAFVKKKGSIVTFKEKFYPRGTLDKGYDQIAITRFKKVKSGAIQLEGVGRDSRWYNSLDELIDAIDWGIMENWHS